MVRPAPGRLDRRQAERDTGHHGWARGPGTQNARVVFPGTTFPNGEKTSHFAPGELDECGQSYCEPQPLEPFIALHDHARTIHASEIHWHSVRLVMAQGSADAFSRGHLSHGVSPLFRGGFSRKGHSENMTPSAQTSLLSDCSLKLGIARCRTSRCLARGRASRSRGPTRNPGSI